MKNKRSFLQGAKKLHNMKTAKEWGASSGDGARVEQASTRTRAVSRHSHTTSGKCGHHPEPSTWEAEQGIRRIAGLARIGELWVQQKETAPTDKVQGLHKDHGRGGKQEDSVSQRWLIITSRKKCFPDTTGQVHIWTQGNCDSMLETLTNSSQTKILAQRERGHKIPPIAK